MANPGPNIVAPSLQRGFAVLSVTATAQTATKSTVTPINYTVSGLAVGDFVTVSPTKAVGAGVTLGKAFVPSANTLTVEYINVTTGDVTTAADTYLALVARSYPTQTDFGVTTFNNIGTVAGSNP
jgi:ribosomal protein L2